MLPFQLAPSTLPTPSPDRTNSNPVAGDILCSPRRIKISNRTTASEILAAFSPKPQPPKKSTVWLSPPKFEITMSKGRDLRQKEQVSYTISDDSDELASVSGVSSAFSTPQKPKRTRNIIDLEEDNDAVEEVVRPITPPPRLSAAGHALRQHKDMHLSLRALENGDKPALKKRKISLPKIKQQKPRVVSDAPLGHAARTARNETRDFIATETAAKRAKFFVAKKDYFLPLLPENNHVKRIVEQAMMQRSVNSSEDMVVPYERIEQPQGITATMKPYQLAGLSFLVYLQRNGLSGILGDEMGLGKTLQTLSLIQYLKENRVPTSTNKESRPSLVVCPLSVLSSWMAECRRWTPDLKVIRFHGPINERNRLKKVVSGEEDVYGNHTRSAILKKNQRLTAAGKNIINLESEDELEGSSGVDLVVTTYETFSAEESWFKRAFVWKYIILDEGHKIKNDLSQVSTALQGLGAEFRLILTGTPLQNNMMELWALLHWLYPEVFTDKTSELFKSSFDLSKGKVSTIVMDDARKLLELIMLRRMKNTPGVDLNLPPKTDVLLFVPLTPMQRFWYTRLLTRADKGLLEELFHDAKGKVAKALQEEVKEEKNWEQAGIEELEKMEKEGKTAADWEESKTIMRQAIEQEELDQGKKSAFQKLLNLLMQLRKCCNHPYILPHASPDPYYLGEHVIHASGKFIVLDKLIEELVVKRKKKVLIFSGFTRMLDCCEDFLALRGGDGEAFKYVRLDGGTGRARRNLGIRLFNNKESGYRVMLISTRAGGLGVNLASASDVIMLDQDWNPQIMLQAEARAHRIGQTQPVTVYKLCTQGTVEEQMMGRIQKKLYLSAKVTESMRDIHSTPGTGRSKQRGRPGVTADEDAPKLNTSQLMSLVRRGAQALSHPEIDVDDMVAWDFNTMLEKCKDKPADIHVAEQTQCNAKVSEEAEKKWLAQIEQVESRVFQGKAYTSKKNVESSFGLDRAREERRVGKNTTVMVDGFAISKESMACGEWEAVPTMAGKDPRLAEPTRKKKAAVENQGHCQVCWDGGELILCSTCPRSYHYMCLDKHFKTMSKAKTQFHCPQHQCADCLQKTGDAGGMIYRCRWCERGYCEDCLEFDKTTMIGNNLQEYELLGFPEVSQAFYISCPSCKDHHTENLDAKNFCETKAQEYDEEYKQILESKSSTITAHEADGKMVSSFSRAGSMTDATTLDESGLSTPQVECADTFRTPTGMKRKSTSGSFKTPVKKRSQHFTM
ncbi:hypothetical protein MMC11_002913 [Xylographa trunciseda]|nr:hypothetical protein [Xylographa trunciseda]